uniref:Uncharacterized protein n=1 Tax=Anguilla anguilla TaxID=7936 RepID=A0A0E9PN76_ANGAN
MRVNRLYKKLPTM